jgi:PAS domain S-box-containing protein
MLSVVILTNLIVILVFRAISRSASKRLENLSQEHLQLNAVFDTMTEAIVVVDRRMSVAQHNRAASMLLGLGGSNLSLEEVADRLEVSSAAGEPLARVDWPVARAMQGKFCKDLEVMIRRKDTGALVTAEITTVSIAAHKNESPNVIVSLRDVGERKKLEAARIRLAQIVESSEDAIIGKDAQGIITSWNRGAEKVFGYTSTEMVGHSIRRLLPEGHEEEEDEILRRIHRGETLEHVECERKRKDGEPIQVSLTISPIIDAVGNVVGASKIARDITERKRLERRLHQSEKMEAIGQLTGGIAHDFNNLLAIILGNLDLLESAVANDEVAANQVRTSQRAAARGADLTRRLLAFARMESLNPSPASLNSSIENVIAMASRLLGPEIAIKSQADDSLPLVFVDQSGLESALLNLVVNARDAMPDGGTISISCRLVNIDEADAPAQTGDLKPGQYACASISDTGHGMSQDTLKRAFEPFFSTKPRDKATGLGLAMVYGFANQSGGTVRLYSEVDVGTTVSIYLPVADGHLLQEIVVDEEQPVHNLGATVLMVDDEPDLLEIGAAYLTEMGCVALQAVDGASALAIFQAGQKISLLLTDLIMPGGMTGVELAHHVRELSPDTKIIYSSGFPANALAERKISLGDDVLLRKPYRRTEFEAIVRSVLEGSRH